jgi:hypothetical protein
MLATHLACYVRDHRVRQYRRHRQAFVQDAGAEPLVVCITDI